LYSKVLVLSHLVTVAVPCIACKVTHGRLPPTFLRRDKADTGKSNARFQLASVFGSDNVLIIIFHSMLAVGRSYFLFLTS